MKLAVIDFLQFIRQNLNRLRRLWVIVLASLLLSGCVNYHVGVNFEGAQHGQIVQQIKLGERLTDFGGSQVTTWLKSIERRAKKLQGKTKYLSKQEILVTIPFNTGRELEAKFNQFFNPVVKKNSKSKAENTEELPNFNSKLHLNQDNFFLWQQNRLSYDLDLRSLGVLSSSGNVVVSADSLLDLQFSLETPWGARSLEENANAIPPDIYNNGHRLVWNFKPGQLNHIEVVFWLPSSLGIGTVVIVLFVLGGFYFKYKSFPWTATKSISSTQLPEGQES